MLDGELSHFSAGGLYNGLVLLIDDETRTYWDHITGEAVHGPRKGARMEVWSIEISSTGAALARYPELQLCRSRPTLVGRAMGWVLRHTLGSKGFLPPNFSKTMGEADTRLPALSHGLGVVVDGRARFYPMGVALAGLEDEWGRRTLTVRAATDGVPFAVWEDGSRPFQLFARWYGFSFTYPDCEVSGGPGQAFPLRS